MIKKWFEDLEQTKDMARHIKAMLIGIIVITVLIISSLKINNYIETIRIETIVEQYLESED